MKPYLKSIIDKNWDSVGKMDDHRSCNKNILQMLPEKVNGGNNKRTMAIVAGCREQEK